LLLVNNNTPERVVRLIICVPILLVACSAGNEETPQQSLIELTGQIENKKLDEASGLARSNREDDLYWAINDDGPAVVHALSASGSNLGAVEVLDARNRDWEDLASFTLNDTAYLAIADIGDNNSRHKAATVYVIEEPNAKDAETNIAWRIDFTYPDGPLDAESLAVDALADQIYVLSKRSIPATLYRLPLQPPVDEIVAAERMADLGNLPQPSADEIRNAAGNGWHWQPTGMDFAPDRSSALILTYAGINYLPRTANQSWTEALQGQAMQLKLGKLKKAEAIAYSSDAQAAIVTVEKKHAPILRVDLSTIEP
jgi:hypothetical protein